MFISVLAVIVFLTFFLASLIVLRWSASLVVRSWAVFLLLGLCISAVMVGVTSE
jgi:hypothetical protein